MIELLLLVAAGALVYKSQSQSQSQQNNCSNIGSGNVGQQNSCSVRTVARGKNAHVRGGTYIGGDMNITNRG